MEEETDWCGKDYVALDGVHVLVKDEPLRIIWTISSPHWNLGYLN